MSYVITWWEGEVRCHVQCKDEQVALDGAVKLRVRSDAYADRSLVPIRVMPLEVHARMKALEKAHDETKCRHGLLRLCLRCLPL